MNHKRPLSPLGLLKLALLFGLMGAAEQGHAAGAGHVDPFSDILFALAVVIMAAVIGRWAATSLHQASVLGELLMGVLVGNLLYWMGGPVAYLVMHLSSVGEVFGAVWNSGLSVAEAAGRVFTSEELAPGAPGDRILGLLNGNDGARLVIVVAALWIFSNLGVILLLFMVGLESRVEEMGQVGPSAIAVALLGVVIPFGLGYVVSALLLTEQPVTLHLFIGATLVATSVGITARVLKDLDAIHSAEAKLILGAAVIDDVLGLIVLAVVTGIVVTGAVQVGEISPARADRASPGPRASGSSAWPPRRSCPGSPTHSWCGRPGASGSCRPRGLPQAYWRRPRGSARSQPQRSVNRRTPG